MFVKSEDAMHFRGPGAYAMRQYTCQNGETTLHNQAIYLGLGFSIVVGPGIRPKKQ